MAHRFWTPPRPALTPRQGSEIENPILASAFRDDDEARITQGANSPPLITRLALNELLTRAAAEDLPCTPFVTPQEGLALLAALERARVVEVLDGYAARFALPVPTPAPTRSEDESREWVIVFIEGPVVYGPTPDAARAAAAQAIEKGEV